MRLGNGSLNAYVTYGGKLNAPIFSKMTLKRGMVPYLSVQDQLVIAKCYVGSSTNQAVVSRRQLMVLIIMTVGKQKISMFNVWMSERKRTVLSTETLSISGCHVLLSYIRYLKVADFNYVFGTLW